MLTSGLARQDDEDDDTRRKVPAPSTSQQGAEECKQQ